MSMCKASMSQKIECKQVGGHLDPKWAKSTHGNARENKQERVDGSKSSGKWTHCPISMTFRAELHPKKLQSMSLSHTSNASCMCETIQNTETHKVLTQTFLFTAFLVYFYRSFSRKEKLWKKLHSFQHQCNGVGVGMGIFRLSFLKNLS